MTACAANSSAPHLDVRGSSTEAPNSDVQVLDGCPLCAADSLVILDSTANICECKRCGYVFDNPRPTLSALVAFYSQPTKYDQWLTEETARDALWTRRLRLLQPNAKPRSEEHTSELQSL